VALNWTQPPGGARASRRGRGPRPQQRGKAECSGVIRVIMHASRGFDVPARTRSPTRVRRWLSGAGGCGVSHLTMFQRRRWRGGGVRRVVVTPRRPSPFIPQLASLARQPQNRGNFKSSTSNLKCRLATRQGSLRTAREVARQVAARTISPGNRCRSRLTCLSYLTSLWEQARG